MLFVGARWHGLAGPPIACTSSRSVSSSTARSRFETSPQVGNQTLLRRAQERQLSFHASRDPGCAAGGRVGALRLWSAAADVWVRRMHLLTAEEVAEALRVPRSWVYAEARAGRLPHVRLGRYVR